MLGLEFLDLEVHSLECWRVILFCCMPVTAGPNPGLGKRFQASKLAGGEKAAVYGRGLNMAFVRTQ